MVKRTDGVPPPPFPPAPPNPHRGRVPVSTAQPAPAAVAGPIRDLHPEKCPITGRPFFMVIDHPELGDVPTYGGPFDSYTIPTPDGEPTDPWHERKLRCERFDHDAGYWVEGGELIPLRIVHEDVLFKLQEDAEAAAPTPQQEAQEPADEFQPCPSCFGTGVEGDADDYGRTIDVTCGECNGSGRAKATTQPAHQQEAHDSLRTDALQSLSYCHGLKAGWNFCVAADEAGYARAMSAIPEALRALKQARQPSPAPQPAPASQGDALDAARYRWLRDSTEWEPFDSAWLNKHDIYGCPTPAMDAAIDAARAAHQEGEAP